AHDLEVQENASAIEQVESFFTSMVNIAVDLVKMFAGYNAWAKLNNFGRYVEFNGKTIIRLADADGFKYGGGERVSKLSLNDNWIAPEGASSYGQAYEYTKEENGELISSGVAYEPMAGGEESVLTEFRDYTESTPLASAHNLYVQEP